MRSPRFLAISAAWRVGLVGPVGSSHLHGTRSGRRYQISFTRHIACAHGVVDVHSAVVRSTETMAIHSNTVAYRQRRYLSTKMKIVFTSMRVLVLCWLQRPGANRQVTSWIAASKCGV